MKQRKKKKVEEIIEEPKAKVVDFDPFGILNLEFNQDLLIPYLFANLEASSKLATDDLEIEND